MWNSWEKMSAVKWPWSHARYVWLPSLQALCHYLQVEKNMHKNYSVLTCSSHAILQQQHKQVKNQSVWKCETSHKKCSGAVKGRIPSSEIEKEINPTSRICYLLVSNPIWVKARQHISLLCCCEAKLPTGADFLSVFNSLHEISCLSRAAVQVRNNHHDGVEGWWAFRIRLALII